VVQKAPDKQNEASHCNGFQGYLSDLEQPDRPWKHLESWSQEIQLIFKGYSDTCAENGLLRS
jgi:hypothetical protein